jgi:hypothetical protein
MISVTQKHFQTMKETLNESVVDLMEAVTSFKKVKLNHKINPVKDDKLKKGIIVRRWRL